jgi:hypothetical protein
MSTSWHEHDTSGAVSITSDGIIIHRRGRINFDVVLATVLADLAEANIAYGSAHPDNAYLFCRNIELAPEGQVRGRAGQTKGKEYYWVDAEYATGSFSQQQKENHLEESVEFSLKEIYMEGGKWEGYDWVVGRDDPGCVKRIPMIDWVIQITQSDFVAYNTLLLGVIGKVNDDTWKGGAAKTWLCMPPSARKITCTDGTVKWIYTLRFSYLGPGGANACSWVEPWCAKIMKFVKMLFKNKITGLYTDELYEAAEFDAAGLGWGS